MNVSKWTALAAIAATVVTVGYRAAHAQAAACNNQPNMGHALGALKSARGYLDRAEHDKGGWRAKAIESADTAIRETEKGCAYADTH
jgi:hypothetical protein